MSKTTTLRQVVAEALRPHVLDERTAYRDCKCGVKGIGGNQAITDGAFHAHLADVAVAANNKRTASESYGACESEVHLRDADGFAWELRCNLPTGHEEAHSGSAQWSVLKTGGTND